MTSFDQFAGDVRYALRALRRTPGFTIASLATLSVGIATLAAIGSVFYGVYLRPLPFRDPERLAAITEYVPGGPRSFSSVTAPTIRAMQRENRAFERMAVFQSGSATVVDGDRVRYLPALYVDTGFAALLDIRPLVGRFLSREEIEAGAHVATISDMLFRSLYGGDSSVIGRALTLVDTSYIIVGVLPRGFRFPNQTDVWLPLPRSALSEQNAEASVVGRIRQSVTRDQARAALAVIASRLPPNARGTSSLVLQDEALNRRTQNYFPQPGILLGAALLVLLAAVTNVTNLFMARATGRRGEMALRAALGASPLQVAMLALIESALLAFGAMVGGVAMSLWIVKLGFAFLPTYTFPFWLHFDLDFRLLAFCVGLALAIAVSVGLAPARYGASLRLMGILRGAGDGAATARASGRLGAAFQIAMGVVLFAACGLLLRSHSRLLGANLGYPAGRIVQVLANFDLARYPRERSTRLVESLLPQFEALRGVAGVATRGYYIGPLSLGMSEELGGPPDLRLFLDGDTLVDRSPAVRPRPRTFAVSEGYFALLDLKVQPGRGFTRHDAAQSTPVVVLSRAFGSALWGSANPIGHRLQVGARGVAYTVVGIVDDVNDVDISQVGISFRPHLDAYFSARQALGRSVGVYIRTEGDIAAVKRAAVEVMRRADPVLRILPQTTMLDDLDSFLALNRVFTALVGAFAIIALTIAAIGLYALIAYGITLRTREIGIRVALGARRAALVAMIVRESLPMLFAGLTGGIVVGFGTASALRYFLYNVPVLDPASYLAAVCLVAIVGLAACVIPMWLASGLDISRVLRAE